MRVVKDEVLNQKIQLLEFSAAVELLSDGQGNCTGAILQDLDNKRYVVVAAKTVILATGGIGRLHIQGFPTSNHYGATGDALPMSYRLGAKLLQIDTFQYHPTGAVSPEQLIGALVTEGIRSEGGHLVNARGERFVNELDTRDVVSSSIIRECEGTRGCSMWRRVPARWASISLRWSASTSGMGWTSRRTRCSSTPRSITRTEV